MIPELTRLRIIHTLSYLYLQTVQMLRTCLGCRPGKMKQESYLDSLKNKTEKLIE